MSALSENLRALDAHLFGDGRARVLLEADAVALIREALRLAAAEAEAMERRCAEWETFARDFDPVSVVDAGVGATPVEADARAAPREAAADGNVVAFPVLRAPAFSDGREREDAP